MQRNILDLKNKIPLPPPSWGRDLGRGKRKNNINLII
jgi:hypothetical protein